ncbi:MAG: PAS domain S-box protein [Nitrospirota bacterium]
MQHMIEKDRYLEELISQKAQFWVQAAILLGIVLFPFIGIADYFITPENFKKFFIYRVGITSIFVLLFFLNRLKRNKNYQYAIMYFAMVFSAATIELMILSFGGHASTYYAGMNLLIIATLGLIPFSLQLSILASLSIYAIYFIPIIFLDNITNPQAFIANNIFIASTYAICLTWRTQNQRMMVNELSLQYDLDQQKKQLQEYSLTLEDTVRDRTLELQKSEQWHRSLFENATDGIVVLDKNGTIINVNNKTCEMHGYEKEELIGTPIWLLESDPNRDVSLARMNRLLNGESLVFEVTQLKKDGTRIPLEISSKTVKIGDEIYVQSFYRDISEKKQLQEHLFQSQKLDSIGVLAGGIAHDFNNVLTAILGHTDILRLSPNMDTRCHRSLQVIEDASRKAGAMITKLLGFARKSSYEVLTLNLNDVVHDTIKLVDRVIGKNIHIQLELAEHLPFIRGDYNQIEQVIMNLLINARDAMPKGGRIVITSEHKIISKGMIGIPAYIEPDEYVQITITDTGIGIPKEIRDKIFEPFFTTKDRGKGTGLGLSMCYGAIKDHNGYILLKSRVDVGTTFTILLPVSKTTITIVNKEVNMPIAGTETILLVDDEKDILSAMQEALFMNGYTVMQTSDPVSAVDIFRKKTKDIALVVTDMVMPNLNGKELMKQLRIINPEIRILAISGYIDYVAHQEDIKNTAWFLQKPFQSQELLVTIRKILDSKTNNPTPITA